MFKYEILTKEALYHKNRYRLKMDQNISFSDKGALLAQLDWPSGAPFGGEIDILPEGQVVATVYTD